MNAEIRKVLDHYARQLALADPVSLPEQGMSAEDVINALCENRANDPDFHSNQLFGLVYPTAQRSLEKVIEEANRLYLWGNALNMPRFPNLTRMAHEVVMMAGGLLHQPAGGGGSITSGGTESIMMSMLVNREQAFQRGVRHPQILAPYSAHPAFPKVARYLGMEYITFPYDTNYKACVREAEKHLVQETSVIVGTAMTFSHSSMDPISALAELAAEHGIGCHVDACVGGFILPFIERLGYEVEPWDFRVPGVTQISLDLHKYGYTTKGASIILHRDSDWLEHQFFLFDDWPSGLYGTPSVAGARPATNIVTAWAVLNHLGIAGYTELARLTMTAAEKVRRAVEENDMLYLVGDPSGPMLAFGSHTINIRDVGERLAQRGWHFDQNVEPESLHVMFSPAHVYVVDQFIADLQLVTGFYKQ